MDNSPCIDAGDPALPGDPDATIKDIGACYFEQISAPAISVSTDTLTFPETFLLETSTLSLTIENSGSADLIIDSMIIDQSQEIFTLNWNPANNTLAPGENLEINVSFTPLEVTMYINALTIYNNDEAAEITLLGPSNLSVGWGGGEIPADFILNPAYPNPFNNQTVLEYVLPSSAEVGLIIYDVSGSVVTQLVSGIQTSGSHRITWDAKGFTSGVYFARLTAGSYSATQKILLIK